jgi:tetratricopeptide (TPR) repeat protein
MCIGLIALFGRAIVSRGWSNAGMLSLGRALRSSGAGVPAPEKLAHAESLFRKALEMDSRNASAHRGLGFIFWEQGAQHQAGDQWRRAGVAYMDFVRTGGLAARLGNPDKALDWYRRAIALAPYTSDPYVSAALILAEMEGEEQALALLEHALALDAFDNESVEIVAHAARADFLYSLGQRREAMADYEWVVARSTGNYWSTLRVGALAWELDGDAVRAEIMMLRALEINPKLKWAYSRLGDLYRDLGRRDEALQMFLKVLELDPDDEYALKRAKSLDGEGSR